MELQGRTLGWLALGLRSSGARTTAFPFDWNVAPLSAMAQLLRSDFGGFLEDVRFGSPRKRILVDEESSGRPETTFFDHLISLSVIRQGQVPRAYD